MQPAYQLTFPGMHPTVHKGKIEAIKLSVVQRASNKKVIDDSGVDVIHCSDEKDVAQFSTDLIIGNRVN